MSAGRKITAGMLVATSMATALSVAGTGVASAKKAETTTTTTTAPPARTADPALSFGSLAAVTGLTGAQDMWACGWTGAGVGVALIDTGVATVPGSGSVSNGADLSFDGQAGAPAGVDAYGHGTHLASIINGRDANWAPTGSCRLGSNGSLTPAGTLSPSPTFAGVAPNANLINIKVGANDGSADVTQLIAAINWAIEHRTTHNIKVLVMAVSVDGSKKYQDDPVSYAAEVARRYGITVVAAAGNDGTTKDRLSYPSGNPTVIAVGSHDFNGSTDPAAWTVSDFSDRGWKKRPVDLLAPGRSIEGLAVPGSVAATMNPAAIVDGRFIKGSGSSQAAAVVGGLAALLLQRYPTATPEQVKAMLQDASTVLPGAATKGATAAAPTADGLLKVAPRTVAAAANTSNGRGNIQESRGDTALDTDTFPLRGEIDVQGNPWNASAWAAATAAGTTWSGGKWMGVTYTGTPTDSGVPVAQWSKLWTGAPLDGTWDAGMTWDGFRWTGFRWTNLSWDGFRWTAFRWTGFRWTGFRWTGDTWTGFSWR